MLLSEFEKIFIEEAQKINIELDKNQIEKFYKYMDLLIEWNEKINLTAITNRKDILVKHFIDSLTIQKYLGDAVNIIDVGTGAGFPGIPVKIVNPNLKVVLVDSLNKRINFLQEVIKKLNLDNIEVIHARAEDLGQNKKYRETFDIVTSRAVANMSVLSEYLLPLAKVNGKCICMKGSDIEEELENSRYAINLLGGKIEQVDKFELSNERIGRNIIIVKKLKNTPNSYPRKAGIPAKKPLI